MSKNPLVVGSSERPTDSVDRLDDMNQPPRLRPNRDRHDWERILALNEAFGSSSLTEANKTWSTTCVFSASDYNTVAWTSGVIDFADGNQYSIGAGNTGNMTGGTVYWIYFDSTVSATALQVTSTASDLASDTVLVMCTAKAASSSSSRAFFVPIFGALQVSDINIAVNSISTNMIQANAVTADEISVNNLQAISVECGTLTGGVLQNAAGSRYVNLDAVGSQFFIYASSALSVTADGNATFYGTLSAAAGTLGTITAGLLQNAAGTRYVDLNASSTQPFIKHNNLELLADGSANFSGTLKAAYIAVQTASAADAGRIAATSGNLALQDTGGVDRVRVFTTGVYIGVPNGGLLTIQDGGGTSQTSIETYNTQFTKNVKVGGSSYSVGFYGSNGSTKQTISTATAAAIITALANLGLVTDGT